MSGHRPWLLLPIETKVREFHAKLLLAAVAAEQGFQVLLGEQNAMLAQRRHLPRGIYLDKSVARTKTANFRRLKAAGNRVAAWCEEGLVYRDRDTYLRIHGTPQPQSIGGRASSGCVRMIMAHINQLYPNVQTGSTAYLYSAEESVVASS